MSEKECMPAGCGALLFLCSIIGLLFVIGAVAEEVREYRKLKDRVDALEKAHNK